MIEGDYVRTKYGIIAKITHIYEDHAIDCDRDVYYVDSLKDDMPMMEIPYYLKDTYIIKSSPNIIDLIEVGDIIKYHPMQNNYVKTNILYKAIKNGRELIELEYDLTHKKKKILSIVTKEQFESMEYKLED